MDKFSNYTNIKYPEVVNKINLFIPAGNARPEPPVGPIVSQLGLKAKDFCDKFNELTSSFEKNLIISCYIYIYKDLSYDIILKTPPISFLVKLIMKEPKTISLLNLYKIFLIKKLDFPLFMNQSIMKSIIYSLKSMKIKIKYD